jgi:glycosyltransferase involved in cell wall biosynthesis
LRIAIYHPWIYLKSGLERTILEIKRRSRHDWEIFTSFYDRERTYPDLQQMGVTELERVSVNRTYGEVISAGLTIARTRIARPGLDALLVCCDGLGSFVNFANPELPSACLCFTPLRAVYDPEYRARHLSPSRLVRAAQHAVAAAYRQVDRRAWRYYRHVFCISHEVERRVLSGRLSSEHKLEIAYPGIDAAMRAKSDERQPFFFLPGRIMWTKNIQLAIRAYQRFASTRSGEGFSLKIAGMVDEKSRSYFQELRELAGADPSIEFVVDPTDRQMQDYYRVCHAVLLTAFNEDLGITPIEAGAFGKPVIAVDRGGPREVVVRDETGLLVEPDEQAFAEALSKLASDLVLASRLGAANYERSALFTWDRFVESIDRWFDAPSAAEPRTNGEFVKVFDNHGRGASRSI